MSESSAADKDDDELRVSVTTASGAPIPEQSEAELNVSAAGADREQPQEGEQTVIDQHVSSQQDAQEVVPSAATETEMEEADTLNAETTVPPTEADSAPVIAPVIEVDNSSPSEPQAQPTASETNDTSEVHRSQSTKEPETKVPDPSQTSTASNSASSSSTAGSSSTAKSTTAELEVYLKSLFNEETTRNTAETVLKTLTEIAQRLPGQVGSALKTMREFVQEFTNIKGVQLNLLFFRILDVQIHTMREADIPVNQKLPVGKIDAVHLGQKVHMQVGMGDGKKDLQMNIKEGLSLIVNLGILGKKNIPVKGTARLTRDEKGNLVMAATTNVPGTEFPITVNIPIKLLVGEIRKQSK